MQLEIVMGEDLIVYFHENTVIENGKVGLAFLNIGNLEVFCLVSSKEKKSSVLCIVPPIDVVAGREYYFEPTTIDITILQELGKKPLIIDHLL